MYEVALVLNLLVFLGMGFVFFTRPYASIYHPAFYYLFFHGLVFVLRPILVWAGDYRSVYQLYGFYPSPSDKLTALFVAMLGFVAFMAACLRYGAEPMTFRQGARDELHRKSLALPLLVTFAIGVPLGVYSLFGGVQQSLEGSWDMVRDAATGISINTTSTGYIKDAQLMLVPLSVLFAWYFRFRWWSFLPMVAFVFFRASIGGRGPFMVGVTSLGLIYLYHLRARWPRWWMVGAFCALLALFSQIGTTRGVELRRVLQGGDGSVLVHRSPETRLLEGMDFANLEFLEYIVYTIPQRTHTYGYFLNNLQVFTEPVPRMLWSGKPVGAPIQLYNLFDYGFPIGITTSLPGEGWSQLGWGGVILWCGLFGFLAGKLYAWFAAGEQRNLVVLAYLVMLPQFLIFFRDGGLLTLFKGNLFFLLPIVLLILAQRLLNGPGYSQIDVLLRRADIGSSAARSSPSPADESGAEDATLSAPARRRRKMAALDARR